MRRSNHPAGSTVAGDTDQGRFGREILIADMTQVHFAVEGIDIHEASSPTVHLWRLAQDGH